jgi:hypothetical protein
MSDSTLWRLAAPFSSVIYLASVPLTRQAGLRLGGFV